jgi:DNA-binding MarR family transcriptional regulator
MSTARHKEIPGIEQAPFIGALLRMAHQKVVARLLEVLAARGLDDISPAHFGLFLYPPIDGMRPTDLAKRLGISKQALNHLLGQLEKLGYLQRRRDTAGHAGVYFTERGWLVMQSNVATMLQIEAEWHGRLGARRFADIKAVLRELAGEV